MFWTLLYCHPNKRDKLSMSDWITFSISLSKVAPALHNPNGIFVNCQWPPPGIEKAVLVLSAGDISTCQYLLLRSIGVNHFAPDRALSVVSILKIG